MVKGIMNYVKKVNPSKDEFRDLRWLGNRLMAEVEAEDKIIDEIKKPGVSFEDLEKTVQERISANGYKRHAANELKDKQSRSLIYDHDGFWYRIDPFEDNVDGRRVDVQLLDIDCSFEMLCFIKACCQTFLDNQEFAHIKAISNNNDDGLAFEIVKDSCLKVFARQGEDDDAGEMSYDYQNTLMLISAIDTCLEHMMWRPN